MVSDLKQCKENKFVIFKQHNTNVLTWEELYINTWWNNADFMSSPEVFQAAVGQLYES